MNPKLSKQAMSSIESLCELGCTQINQLIDDANNGKDVALLSNFETPEITLIIDELRQIMAVYNKE